MKRCQLSSNYSGAVCQFAVESKYDLSKLGLQDELRRRLSVGAILQVDRQTKRNERIRAYRITFPLGGSSLGVGGSSLSRNSIMDCLESIEKDVEKALRIKKLAEMVE